jgi:hypothetical protein
MGVTLVRTGLPVAIAAPIAAMGLALMAALLAAPGTSLSSGPSAAALGDIPPDYLAAYEDAAGRFGLGPIGWSVLAAIGKVESDHGRSTAPGVHSGQNAHGCCAGPMQIHNGFGSGGGTWGAYKVSGDGDGRPDIYSPADSIATAARYLRASGAPADWRTAIFAYNHADWYIDKVLDQAESYRAAVPSAEQGYLAPFKGDWLARVPGQYGERCDARIVPDVLLLVREFGVDVTACYGGAPHALNGEHPLGLATDLVPSNGDWRRTHALAESFGWQSSCASAGCPARGPFRVVLYNGYPGHGDPAHTGTPHLHLSWSHGAAKPFSPAPWVRTLLDPAGLKGAAQ